MCGWVCLDVEPVHPAVAEVVLVTEGGEAVVDDLLQRDAVGVLHVVESKVGFDGSVHDVVDVELVAVVVSSSP